MRMGSNSTEGDSVDDRSGTDSVSWAATIARVKHAGQEDKAGADYFGHCTRVAAKLDDDTAKAVALLHDVLEDTGTLPDTLRAMCADHVSNQSADEIVDAVAALTRAKDGPAEEYYRGVRANPLALRVKIADIHDNLEPSRLAVLSEERRRYFMNKYGHALVELAK
ncbi:MAG: hypothetical protein WCJ13_09105 [Coriobacteriia bacterium]